MFKKCHYNNSKQDINDVQCNNYIYTNAYTYTHTYILYYL